MLVIRAITLDDLDPLIEMAHQVGSGMTTLKPDRAMLGDRVATAVGLVRADHRAGRARLHVRDGRHRERPLAGVCAIKAAVGLNEPFYNYRIGTLVHSSRELDVFTRMDTLYLSNDLTGSTELCSLFLQPEYRKGHNGKWLSKSRFLFIAQFRTCSPKRSSPRCAATRTRTAPRRSTKAWAATSSRWISTTSTA
jgi:arginine N-succinyltransferase